MPGKLLLLVSMVLSLGVLASSAATAQETQASPSFGGPDAVPNQIQSDVENAERGEGTGIGERWDRWKSELQSEHGLGLGIDYTSVYQNASDTVPGGEDEVAAGMLRFYGSWDLIGRESGNTGTFTWKVEHRHDYGDPPPSPLWAATDLGYVGLENPPFSDQGFRTTNFYWRQRFNSGHQSVVVGFLDVTDFVDLYGLVSPWLHFTNFVFTTGSATMDLPNDAALGFGGASMLGSNFYVIGTFVDANSDPEDLGKGFDSFRDDNEYYKSVELGWTSGKDAIYLDNYHVTVWHKDERDEFDKPDGRGVNLSFARYVDERWMPFLRAGWSDDGDSLLERSVSTGLGFQLRDRKDLIGFGLNWGEPNPNQGAPDEDQYSAELFYRLMVGKRLQITADLQYLKDPAANLAEDSIWILGTRGRLAF
jgi:porin